MKNKDKDKCKGKESTIGKIIYGFLLFLPLFAIGTTCLISTFNMSAKEESEIHYKYETNEVKSNNDLIPNHIYDLDLDLNTDNEVINFNKNAFRITIVSGSLTLTLNGVGIDDYYTPMILDGMYTVYFGNGSDLYLYNGVSDSSGDFYVSVELSQVKSLKSNNLVILYDYIDTDTYDDDLCYNFSSTTFNVIDYVETHNVSAQDVFYNAVDKVQESPLFNWTTNTGIYNTILDTCNTLSITTTFIPLLLTYWLIVSVIYFLYDIVLMILHILHKKNTPTTR